MTREMLLLVVLSMLLAVPASVAGNLEFADVFSTGMVLQQNSAVRIWGTGEPGEKVTLEVSWQDEPYRCTVSQSGQWEMALRTPAASLIAHSITLSDSQGQASVIDDVKIGEVWLCSGQSNMEMVMQPDTVWNLHVDNAEAEISAADFPEIRYINVGRCESFSPVDGIVTEGWKVCSPESVGKLSAVGYYFARRIQQELDVPVGLIICAYGGSPIQSWLPEDSFDSPFYADEKARLQACAGSGAQRPEYNMASSLYNGMFHPVARYTVKGDLWYQGCANVGDAARYPAMMSDLVTSWRQVQGENIPFYYVQIAPFSYPGHQSGRWAELAWSQEVVLDSLGHSGIVITADIGDPGNIHPGRKKPVGERLASMALTKTYGMDIPCCSPSVAKAWRDAGRVCLSFSDTYGSMTSSGEESEFEVSDDGVFFSRSGYMVDGNKIILDCVPEDAEYVRFCWRDNACSNVFNAAGLPLGPFVIEIEK